MMLANDLKTYYVVIVALSLSSVCAILAKSQAEFTQSDIVIITNH